MREIFWVDGRNARGRYWVTALIEFVVLFGYCVLIYSKDKMTFANNLLSFTSLCVIGAVTWVSLINRIRRYHDLDKSGFWIFFALIPIVGPMWQFIELGFRRGTQGDNSYGPGPYATSDHGTSELTGGGLAKVDDAYLENYARRFHEQNVPQASLANSMAGSTQGTASFGRRR